MGKNVQLRIDNPCSENWDHMRPDHQGRFCSSCEKTVVDFTGMSDQEVISWMTQQKGNICGRFQGEQLNRDLVAPPANLAFPASLPPARKIGRLVIWRYLLTGLLLSSEASSISAQSKSAGPPVSQHDSTSDKDIVTAGFVTTQQPPSRKNDLPEILRGRLMDENGRPIPYASIMTRPGHGYVADSTGYFAIPRNSLSDEHTLTISSVGYQTLVIDAVRMWKNDDEKIIPLKMQERLMGDVVVAGKVAVTRIKPSKKAAILLRDSLACIGFTKKALAVYPNPVARGAAVTLSVRLDEPGTYTVQLFSMSGALEETMPVESKTVLMNIPATIPAGIYFIKLSHPAVKKVYTQQVVVL
jgi:hypothetical protein